jgi:hypothetical protein
MVSFSFLGYTHNVIPFLAVVGDKSMGRSSAKITRPMPHPCQWLVFFFVAISPIILISWVILIRAAIAVCVGVHCAFSFRLKLEELYARANKIVRKKYVAANNFLCYSCGHEHADSQRSGRFVGQISAMGTEANQGWKATGRAKRANLSDSRKRFESDSKPASWSPTQDFKIYKAVIIATSAPLRGLRRRQIHPPPKVRGLLCQLVKGDAPASLYVLNANELPEVAFESSDTDSDEEAVEVKGYAH